MTNNASQRTNAVHTDAGDADTAPADTAPADTARSDAQLNSTVLAYSASADPLGDVIDGITDWTAASPCEGWSPGDVVAHIIETEREYFGQHKVDLGPPPSVATDPAAAWHTHDNGVRRLLADDALAERQVDGFFGPTTLGAMFLQVYGFDLVVHRWDVARSNGRNERFSEAELDTLEAAIAGFGDHMYAEGICKPALDVPTDADRQTRVLAAMGRRD